MSEGYVPDIRGCVLQMRDNDECEDYTLSINRNDGQGFHENCLMFKFNTHDVPQIIYDFLSSTWS